MFYKLALISLGFQRNRVVVFVAVVNVFPAFLKQFTSNISNEDYISSHLENIVIHCKTVKTLLMAEPERGGKFLNDDFVTSLDHFSQTG